MAAYAVQMAHLSYSAHHYREAVDLVSQALALAPLRRDAQALLADALFASGDFPTAASAYRKLLDAFPTNQEFIRRCAESFAAGNPNAPGYSEFLQWLGERPGATTVLAAMKQVEQAGLRLRAGAKPRVSELPVVSPEVTARAGWWFYRAGDYSTAGTLLNRAIAQRPGDLAIQTKMAWNDLGLNRAEDGLRRLTAVLDHGTPPGAMMGRAVARWRIGQSEEAIRDFNTAAKAAPEWLNPAWVQGLYPPAVAQAIKEIQPRAASAATSARPPA
jgi:tetratricopeptide (TPR) repeat protein